MLNPFEYELIPFILTEAANDYAQGSMVHPEDFARELALSEIGGAIAAQNVDADTLASIAGVLGEDFILEALHELGESEPYADFIADSMEYTAIVDPRWFDEVNAVEAQWSELMVDMIEDKEWIDREDTTLSGLGYLEPEDEFDELRDSAQYYPEPEDDIDMTS